MKVFRAFLALLPWLLMSLLGVEYFMPTSHWMTIDKLYVHDTAVGEVPQVALDRTVRRPLVVDWFMTLFHNENGTFEAECRANGRDSRTPGEKSPNSLSWWYDGSACIKGLTPGKYYVEEQLEWHGWMVTHTAQVSSNVFTVWPVGDPHLSGMDTQRAPSDAPPRVSSP